MILPITIYPEKILRQKAKKVVDFNSEEFQQLVLDMTETMKKKDGAGLAAPQIGQSVRLIVINTKDGAIALANPKILLKSLKTEEMEEGCLSFPEIFGLVKRPIKIIVSALNKQGKRVRFKAEGLLARVIIHEIDHLKGILFIDKAKKIVQGEKKLQALTK